MTPDKFLARLCALVPPPHFHMTRYFGVFANRHHLRARIIPPSAVPALGQQLTLGLAGAVYDSADPTAESSPRARRLGWANLLARVFAVDVTLCRNCGGRMRILELVTDFDDIARPSSTATTAPSSPRPGPVVPLLTDRALQASLRPHLVRWEKGASRRAQHAQAHDSWRPRAPVRDVEPSIRVHHLTLIRGLPAAHPWTPGRSGTRPANKIPG